MNKKALMVKFLTTLLLAILIFAPACLFAGKLLKISDETTKNFNNFVDEVKAIAVSPDGTKRSYMLILDENSFIFKFTETKDLVTESFNLTYPKECENKECILLCRLADLNDEKIGCSDYFARPLGDNENVAGMFLYRFNIKKPWVSPANTDSLYMSKRQAVQIEKTGGKVHVKRI